MSINDHSAYTLLFEDINFYLVMASNLIIIIFYTPPEKLSCQYTIHYTKNKIQEQIKGNRKFSGSQNNSLLTQSQTSYILTNLPKTQKFNFWQKWYELYFQKKLHEFSRFLSGNTFALIVSIQNLSHEEALSKFMKRKRSLIST